MNVVTKNNFDLVGKELQDAAFRALWRCGMQAESYAADLAPVAERYGGTLRGSITFEVIDTEKEMHVGTNVEYGVYQEMGTGIYAEGGGGRQDPWVYRDDEGNFHWTRGNKAQPFIKPAIADHAQTYKNIIEDELKG